MKLHLHNYRRCPFCIRTRIVLELKQIPHELVHEPLRIWTDWMRDQEKKGIKPRVPALQIVHDDASEEVLFESNAINLWLDANFGDVQCTPEEGTEMYTKMEEWWKWCSEGLKPMIDLYKYGKNRQFDAEENKIYTKQLLELLGKTEETLQDKTYVQGEMMTLVDIAIIPFIRQIMRTRNEEFDFSSLPHTLKWANSMLEEKWFEGRVMRKEKK